MAKHSRTGKSLTQEVPSKKHRNRLIGGLQNFQPRPTKIANHQAAHREAQRQAQGPVDQLEHRLIDLSGLLSGFSSL